MYRKILYTLVLLLFSSQVALASPNFDKSLQSNIEDTIKHNSILSSLNLDIHVKNKTVYVAGEIDSLPEFGKLVMMIMSRPGVKDINLNMLKIINYDQNDYNDILISSKIIGKLIRNHIVDTDIKTWPININTEDAIVELTGTVKDTQTRNKILSIVNSTPGVESIVCKLTINK